MIDWHTCVDRHTVVNSGGVRLSVCLFGTWHRGATATTGATTAQHQQTEDVVGCDGGEEQASAMGTTPLSDELNKRTRKRERERVRKIGRS